MLLKVLNLVAETLDTNSIESLLAASYACYQFCADRDLQIAVQRLPNKSRSRINLYVARDPPRFDRFIKFPYPTSRRTSDIWLSSANFEEWLRETINYMLTSPSFSDKALRHCLPLALVDPMFGIKTFPLIFKVFMLGLSPQELSNELARLFKLFEQCGGYRDACRIVLESMLLVRNEGHMRPALNKADLFLAARAASDVKSPHAAVMLLEMHVSRNIARVGLPLSKVLTLEALRVDNAELVHEVRTVADSAVTQLNDPDSYYGLEHDPTNQTYLSPKFIFYITD